MEKKIKITINGTVHEFFEGTSLYAISQRFRASYEHDIILARVNGKLTELFHTVHKDCELSFVTTDQKAGNSAYRRTTCFLMNKAFNDVLGKDSDFKIVVQYSLGKGIYCELKSDSIELTCELLSRVRQQMKDLASQGIIINKMKMHKNDALGILSQERMTDKERLLSFKTDSVVNLYVLDDTIDYFYGYMAHDTSYIKYFELFKYDEGFVLILPEHESPEFIENLVPSEKLFNAFKVATRWNELMGVTQISDLNQKIVDNEFFDLVLVQEALQEHWIGNIAQQIVNSGKRIILIAGPSSSGKTSFSRRLSVQLKANGLKPHPISVDNYFVNRSETPLDKNGAPNYECLEALNVEKLNEHLLRLLDGEEVTLLRYNFLTGMSEENGEKMKIEKDEVLVIEGIHALNDKMTYKLPVEDKFKIYISALTTLNIDDHSRIASADGRLIRRMCRDAAKRGASAAHTLRMWKSVRRGEDENIFPYQENCDVMFNSTLIYELAVLKQTAVPLLFAVKPEEPEYEDAQLLLKFLDQILGVSTESIPHNSILREFIGGSVFNVE